MEASDGHIMLHTGTVDGAVPAFPSWSVTSLGHANLYNSATGKLHIAIRRLCCFAKYVVQRQLVFSNDDVAWEE